MVVYIGRKSHYGNEAQQAGLVDGELYALSVTSAVDASTGVSRETRAEPLGGRFELKLLRSAVNGSVAYLREEIWHDVYTRAGGTWFLRPEDLAWHPRAPHRFVLATTDMMASRLYRFEFDDIAEPERGGTVVSLLDEVQTQESHPQHYQMLDNVEVDMSGNVLVTEDAGPTGPNRVLFVPNAAGPPGAALINRDFRGPLEFEPMVQHNPQMFGEWPSTPASAGFTRDNEFSGIIDASHIFGPGWFLMSNQAHSSFIIDSDELIEQGQLLALYSPRSASAPPLPNPTYPPPTPMTPIPAPPGKTVVFVDGRPVFVDVPKETSDGGTANGTDGNGTMPRNERGLSDFAIIGILIAVVICFAVMAIGGALVFRARRAAREDVFAKSGKAGKRGRAATDFSMNGADRAEWNAYREKPKSQRSLSPRRKETAVVESARAAPAKKPRAQETPTAESKAPDVLFDSARDDQNDSSSRNDAQQASSDAERTSSRRSRKSKRRAGDERRSSRRNSKAAAVSAELASEDDPPPDFVPIDAVPVDESDESDAAPPPPSTDRESFANSN